VCGDPLPNLWIRVTTLNLIFFIKLVRYRLNRWIHLFERKVNYHLLQVRFDFTHYQVQFLKILMLLIDRVVLILITLPNCRANPNVSGEITILRVMPILNIDYCKTILIYLVFPVVFSEYRFESGQF